MFYIKVVQKNTLIYFFSLYYATFSFKKEKKKEEALPNKRTLHRLSEKIYVEDGINTMIFDHIKIR